ncbi:maleylpyruvate isomerase N-terminal domain-containing protein [Streptomonospora sp. DSM 45055]|uniref:Maleylpyruvate isomerase N-terminal domain-containing protein n=1 Tax=Streptomonospora wellingtoniae TaxID=3075544 RepID=A0ABU2KPC5_9ACTN|nr:maleylpyruvate isomerase N-terminal domain-containing protein [Streptomonospora sp. DSM 45055]
MGLSAAEARLPTRCPPWDVAALAAHTAGALVRVADALDGAGPREARVSAAGYYRPDARFSPEVDGRRIADAAETAARGPASRGGCWSAPGAICAPGWRPSPRAAWC